MYVYNPSYLVYNLEMFCPKGTKLWLKTYLYWKVKVMHQSQKLRSLKFHTGGKKKERKNREEKEHDIEKQEIFSTRSTQRAQTSFIEADHYSHIAHCKNVEPWWWKTTPRPRPPPKKKKQKKTNESLPAPRYGYATTIRVFFCSFTHLRIPRSPPKFNQFFIVLPRTPPQNFIPIHS